MQNNIYMGQIDVIPGRPDKNTKTIIDYLNNTSDGSLTVLPEMAIPGYMIGDMWLRDSFIKECYGFNERVLEVLARKGASAIWGNIDFDSSKRNNDGSTRKYNTAFVGASGKLLGKRYKTLLPNYRMFDDKRYFTSLEELAREEGHMLEEYYKPFGLEIDGVRQNVGVLICEDIWNINGDYGVDPVEMTNKFNPDLIAVTSCSPFGLNKDRFRKKLLEKHSKGKKLVYVNPIGSQNIGKTIHAIDGGSSFYKDGKFISGIRDFTTNEVIESLENKNEMEQIYETLIFSIRDFFKKIGVKKAVIGLSGGIDSGLVATLLTLALGKENVVAVNMPSKFNSDTTKDLAKTLAENLGIEYKIFPIQEAVDLKVRQLEQVTGKKPTDFEIENIQARERGQILSDISANLGGIFTCNGNKDEMLLGYATLYGDVSGAIAPIGDLHKYQVFELSRFINEKFGKEIIPENMINLKPSAELSDKQNPEKGGGDPFNYEFTGRLNRGIVERKLTPADILRFYKAGKLETTLGISGNLRDIFANKEEFIAEIEKTWKLMHINYFKRIQAPPIIQLGKGSFGFDFRESQIEAYFGEEFENLKREILEK